MELDGVGLAEAVRRREVSSADLVEKVIARIEAEKRDLPIRDGDVRTACQQACPAGAIVFGNIHDPGAQVSAMKAEPLNYGLLAELNTRPRTTYLAKVWNPNPEIGEEA